jgi:uncharacterized protein (TIGR03000 family)
MRHTNLRFLLCIVTTFCAGVVFPPSASAQPKGKYAGIEIASTAVRAVVIEYPGDGSVVFLGGREARTGLRGSVKNKKYARPTLEEVAKQVKTYYEELSKEHNIKADGFFVVASSGAATGAENIDELRELLQNVVPALRPMAKLDPEEEIRLGFIGTVPKDDFGTSFLVDIGGGDLKVGFAVKNPDGGFAPPSKEQKGLQLGTNALVALAKMMKGVKYEDAVERIRKERAKEFQELVKAVRATEDGNKRDKVYVVGGAPYALVTLMFPSQAGKSEVVIEYSQVQEYRRKLREKAEKPFGKKPSDEKVLAKFEKEFSNVEDKFTPQQLLAGGELMEGIFDAFDLNHPGKSVTFRNALFAWITKYVEQKTGGAGNPAGAAPIQDAESAQNVKQVLKNQKTIIDAQEKQDVAIKRLSEQLKKLREDHESSTQNILDAIKKIRLTAPPGGAKAPVTDKFDALAAAIDRLAKALERVDPPGPPNSGQKNNAISEPEKLKELTRAVARMGEAVQRIEDDLKDIKQTLAKPSVNRITTTPPVSGVVPLERRALIVANVPANADFFINGSKRESLGQTPRLFILPPMEVGKQAEYLLQMSVTRDGETFSVIRLVTVKAGTEVYLDFSDGESASKPPLEKSIRDRSVIMVEMPTNAVLLINGAKHPFTSGKMREFITPRFESATEQIFTLEVPGNGGGRVRTVKCGPGELVAVSLQSP